MDISLDVGDVVGGAECWPPSLTTVRVLRYVRGVSLVRCPLNKGRPARKSALQCRFPSLSRPLVSCQFGQTRVILLSFFALFIRSAIWLVWSFDLGESSIKGWLGRALRDSRYGSGYGMPRRRSLPSCRRDIGWQGEGLEGGVCDEVAREGLYSPL